MACHKVIGRKTLTALQKKKLTARKAEKDNEEWLKDTREADRRN